MPENYTNLIDEILRNKEIPEDLIEEALQKEEVKSGTEQANLTGNYLVSQIEEHEPKVLEAAATEIEVFQRLKTEEDEAGRRLEELERQHKTSKLVHAGIQLPVIVLFLLGIVGVLTVFPVHEDIAGAITTASLVISVAYSAFFFLRLKAKHQAAVSALRKELGLDKYPATIATAAQAASEAVVNKGIVPELRAVINSFLAPSYETELNSTFAPGLAEISNPEYEVITDSKEAFLHLVDSMPGGSIGVAGPRGSGKTTLLWSLCESSTNTLEGQPVLPILVSAPVKYEPREFVLHIFSTICQRVLELKNAGLQESREDLNDELRMPAAKDPADILFALFHRLVGVREAGTSLLIGIVLIGLSIFFYIDAGASSRAALLPEFLENYLVGALGIKPAHLAYPGFLLSVLGLIGLLSWWRRRRSSRYWLEKQFLVEIRKLESQEPLVKKAKEWIRNIKFQQSYSYGWAGSLRLPIAAFAAQASTNAAVSLAQKQWSLPEIVNDYREFITLASTEYRVIIGIDELDKIESDEAAQRFLNEVKALFGLPNCFYLISVSESAMSNFERRGLPFRDAFDSSFDAVVYVDYLTLSKSQELLRRRVIDLPVPFLDFCHCMAGGLPRDLIRTCRALFGQCRTTTGETSLQVLGSSLIRAELNSKLRAVSVAAKNITVGPEANQLFEVIYELKSNETLWSKPLYLLERCRELLTYADQEQDVPSQEGSETEVAELSQSVDGQRPLNETAHTWEQLSSLSTEFGVYLYYSVTLLQFFGENYSPERLKEAESTGALDQLTTARQFLSTNPRIARSIVTEFRRFYNIDPLNFDGSPYTQRFS